MTAGALGALYLAAGSGDLAGEVAILTVETTRRGAGGFRVRRHYSGAIVGRAGWTGCGEVDAVADALATVYGMPTPTASDRVTDRHALAEYAEDHGVYLYAATDLVAMVGADAARRAAKGGTVDRAATLRALRDQCDTLADRSARRHTEANGHYGQVDRARDRLALLRSHEAEVRAYAVLTGGDEGEADLLEAEADRLEAKADRLEAEADRLAGEAADLEAESLRFARAANCLAEAVTS